MRRGIAAILLLAGCGVGGMPADAVAPDAGPVLLWECECWRSVLIGGYPGEAGEVIIPQDQLPTGLQCSTTNPVDAVADALCWEQGPLCGCFECEPTGRMCLPS